MKLYRRVEGLVARWPWTYRVALRLVAHPPAIKLAILQLARRGDVVFDVGANRGYVTAVLSNVVGPAGQVHSFEPSSRTCVLLRQAIAERAIYNNVVVNRCAVSDADGELLLHTPGDDDGQASLRVHSAGSWSDGGGTAATSELCKVIRLDQYVTERSLSRLDLIKIDVEGAERLVIKGFASGLRALRPVVIAEQCSAWSKTFGYMPSEFAADMTAMGYDRLFLLTSSGGLVPAGDVRKMDNTSDSFDIICMSTACHGARMRRALAGARLGKTNRNL